MYNASVYLEIALSLNYNNNIIIIIIRGSALLLASVVLVATTRGSHHIEYTRSSNFILKFLNIGS